jgi:glycosyltransferase involved in cell wall biosynthesis
MNILQVTLRDLVGQRFSGYRLHRSLRDRGHDSSMLVVEKRSDDPGVHSHSRWGELVERGLCASERVTGLQGMLSPFGWSFPLRRCFRTAQVVHWHLIHPHYVSLPSMPWLTGLRPTLWTLHDPWAITGHCVHPLDCQRWRTGCGRCPDLSRNFAVWYDTTALVWRTKRAVFGRTPLTLVVASRWMKSLVEASPLLRSMACHVIPYSLELDRWRPLDREACRSRLGIPPGAKALAFRMPRGHRQQQTKGIPWLLEALRRLPLHEPTYLIVLEEKGLLEELRGRYSLVELGWSNDDSQVAEALTAADLFLMPSTAESFGLMALEAMACGTPVVVTEGTALMEVIRAPSAGVAVPPGDAKALASTIERLLADDSLRSALGRRGREIVEAEHSHDAYVQRHVELYASLLEDQAAGRPIPA